MTKYGTRRNRSKRAGEIAPDEKLVPFRMSVRRYEVLKEIAKKHDKPVAQLINEILDQKLKLEQKATLKSRVASVFKK